MASAGSATSQTEGLPFDLDWANVVESELQEEEPHDWDLCHDYKEFPSSERSEATGDEANEVEYEKDAECITEDDMDLDDGCTHITSIPLTEEVSSRGRLLYGIEEEFRGRDDAMVHDENIHHFNWLGNPVYQRSLTTPAESLAIICYLHWA